MAPGQPGVSFQAWQSLFLQGKGEIGGEEDGEVHHPKLDLVGNRYHPY